MLESNPPGIGSRKLIKTMSVGRRSKLAPKLQPMLIGLIDFQMPLKNSGHQYRPPRLNKAPFELNRRTVAQCRM